MIRPHRWDGRQLLLLDQRRLPGREQWLSCRSAADVARCIRRMVVRGAPAIGIAAAYGLALEALRLSGQASVRCQGTSRMVRRLEASARRLEEARPTAVNLFWAVERMRQVWQAGVSSTEQLTARLVAEAERIDREDVAMNRAIAGHGRNLLAGMKSVLTHCNTGGLATGGLGTALGVIRAAHERQPIHVYACETRPYLQGARLTMWELQQDGIDATLIVDSAAGWVMASGAVQAVITGADRIAANGDAVNKIGTHNLAVLARYHRLPFFVAVPRSSIDLDAPTADVIEIETRDPAEVTHLAGRRLAPAGVRAWNPAFDVTPADLISGIITDAGVARPPYHTSLQRLLGAPAGLARASQGGRRIAGS